MALGTPVAGAAAYSAASGTTVAPAYPSGILTTDAVLLFVGQKPTAVGGGTVTTPTGWTLRDELTNAGGYAAQGADSGNTNLRVYSWNTPVAGQTGNLAVTLGGNNVTWAFMVRVPSGGGALSYGSADGQRTTTPTSPMSIALTNGATATNFASGDRAIWAMCIPTDVTTPSQFSAQSITATGATFGTATELNEPDSTTGNDIGGYSAWAAVTAGSSTTAPTVTATLAGTITNVRGPVVLLRIREAAVTHGTTGSLTGQIGSVAGAADHEAASVPHTSTGALTGQIGGVVGAATRFRAHATSGVLAGQTATITGDADREAAVIPHTTVGDLTGQGSTLAGSATRFRAHATSGAPVGAGSVVTGDADREAQIIPHVTSGALTGQGSSLSGSAFVSHLHATSGALAGPGAEIAGDAELTPYVPTVHDTDGVLTGQESALTGAATRFRAHGSSGVLAGPGASVAGTALRFRAESTSGVLVGPGAIIVGSASRAGAAVTHDTTGILFGPGSIIVGFADHQTGLIPERGDGVGRRWKKRELQERDRKLEQEKLEKNQLRKLIEQAIDPVKDEESVKVVRTEAAVAVVPKSGPAIAIQAPVKFDTKAIAAEVTRALKAIGVEAQRARDAESKRIAEEAFRVAEENVRARVKRKRDDEFLLLM